MNKSKRLKRLFVSLMTFCFIPFSILGTLMMMETEDLYFEEEHKSIIPIVSVMKVEPKEWQAKFVANGLVKPQNKMELTSEVAGRVQKLTKVFVSGMHVKIGDALAYIDPVESQRDLAVAQQTLSEAKVSYLQEERKSKQAKRDWKRLNGNKQPTSPLVLNGPQLEAAKARVNAAEMTVQYAESHLSKTVIRSPFNAVVIERSINRGQTITIETKVATLIERENLEIDLEVNERHWGLLSKDARFELEAGKRIELLIQFEDPLNPGVTWAASSVRMNGERNAKTRQRQLIAELNDEKQREWKLLPSSFVQASFIGAQFKGILEVPTSALSVNGYLWTVDSGNRLKRHKVKAISMLQGKAFVVSPIKDPLVTIVINPLASLLPGQKISPKILKSQKTTLTSDVQVGAL